MCRPAQGGNHANVAGRGDDQQVGHDLLGRGAGLGQQLGRAGVAVQPFDW
ncbi:MAG: hypothetical protein ACRDYA_16535 [Egibacteraceae bacterium]